MTGGTEYGFQVAAVFSDVTQAGALTAVTEDTMVVEVNGLQILTHTDVLEAGMVDFQWTAPTDPKENKVTLKVASNSADGNDRPTGDAINTLDVSIPLDSAFNVTMPDVPMPVELTERLHFAQFANGAGIISQVTLLNVGIGKEVNAKLELRDGNGAPLNVVLNGEMIPGETEVFSIAAGGGASFRKRRQRAGGCRIFDCPCRRTAEGRRLVRRRSSGCGRGRQ